jgi:hypothetical protein
MRCEPDSNCRSKQILFCFISVTFPAVTSLHLTLCSSQSRCYTQMLLAPDCLLRRRGLSTTHIKCTQSDLTFQLESRRTDFRGFMPELMVTVSCDLTSYNFVVISQHSKEHTCTSTTLSCRTDESNYDACSCGNLQVLHIYIIL